MTGDGCVPLPPGVGGEEGGKEEPVVPSPAVVTVAASLVNDAGVVQRSGGHMQAVSAP